MSADVCWGCDRPVDGAVCLGPHDTDYVLWRMRGNVSLPRQDHLRGNFPGRRRPNRSDQETISYMRTGVRRRRAA